MSRRTVISWVQLAAAAFRRTLLFGGSSLLSSTKQMLLFGSLGGFGVCVAHGSVQDKVRPAPESLRACLNIPESTTLLRDIFGFSAPAGYRHRLTLGPALFGCGPTPTTVHPHRLGQTSGE